MYFLMHPTGFDLLSFWVLFCFVGVLGQDLTGPG
jgi:hypothetical protein